MQRIHPSHRYHIIDTGLKPDYYDADIRIEVTILKEAHDFYRDYPWIESLEDDVYEILKRAFWTYEKLNKKDPWLDLDDPQLDSLLYDILRIKGHMWW